jgi:hypothetical protein
MTRPTRCAAAHETPVFVACLTADAALPEVCRIVLRHLQEVIRQDLQPLVAAGAFSTSL